MRTVVHRVADAGRELKELDWEDAVVATPLHLPAPRPPVPRRQAGGLGDGGKLLVAGLAVPTQARRTVCTLRLADRFVTDIRAAKRD